MQRKSQGSEGGGLSESASWVYTIAHVWALPWELVLRRNFGRRYLDLFVLAAMIWPMIFACVLFPQFDARWSIWMFWGLLGLTICHRVAQLRNWRAIAQIHSHYNGYPIFCRPEWDEVWFKRQREPLLMIIVSVLSGIISPSMFLFLLGGLIGIVVKVVMNEFYQEQQEIALNDAMIQQQWLAERFRGRN